MVKKILLFMLVVIITTIGAVFGTLFFKSIDPYAGINTFSTNKVNLVVEDRLIETCNYPITNDNKVLIPVNIIKKYICEDIELSDKYNRVYLNIKNPKFRLESEELDMRMEQEVRLNFATEKINDIEYLNIKGLEKIFDITIDYIEASNLLIIDSFKDITYIGKIKDNTRLRPRKNVFSFSLDKLQEGEKLIVFEKSKGWLKVRTEEGYIGYVQDKKVDIVAKENDIDKQLNKIREAWKVSGKINLAWDYIGKNLPDLEKEDKIEGLDVISPTWFSVVDSNGFVVNNADFKYVNDSHEKGYKVWGLINNSFDKDLTKELLADEAAQENVINQIIIYSSIYNLDGINIDFENVYYEDKDRLTIFVDKLTDALKKQNLIVSMDMTIPSSSPIWSKFYDREKLSQILDYCIVMTYDEHWAASPVSGSVASIGWVDKGIQKTLQYIPKEKLLMGIPLYTREWEETILENGKINVKSKALSMAKVKERIEKYNPEIVWLDDTGQHYIEYMQDGKKYRIWIEDEKSIELKANLVYKYDLAGAASWQKGFEEEGIWEVLNRVLKGNEEYARKSTSIIKN